MVGLLLQDRLSGGQMIIRSDGTIESPDLVTSFLQDLDDRRWWILRSRKSQDSWYNANRGIRKRICNRWWTIICRKLNHINTYSSFPTTARCGRFLVIIPMKTTMSVENVTGFVQGVDIKFKEGCR